jgi:hypothetical protein
VTELCPAECDVTNGGYGVIDILNFRYYEDVVPRERTDKRLEDCGAYVKVQSGTSKRSLHPRSLSLT